MERRAESAYCYYHHKLQTGLCEPHVDTLIVERETFSNEGKRTVRPEAVFRTRTDCYPVWPLPKKGYVLLLPAAAQAA